jgi:hypothetical protein
MVMLVVFGGVRINNGAWVISTCTQILVNGPCTARQYINPRISSVVLGHAHSVILCKYIVLHILCTYLYTKRPVATGCNRSMCGL